MDERVVKGFIDSAVRVLNAELGMDVAVDQTRVQQDHYVAQGVTALVGVTGSLRGMVLFGISEATALDLVSRMLGQDFHEVDDLAQSGIAELGNVVVGAAVTSLAEIDYHCSIAPPAVIVSRDTVISTPNIRRLVVPLVIPTGRVEMQLALRQNGAH